MAAAPTPPPVCSYCGGGGGRHLYDCPVVRDKGTAAPGTGKWWKRY